MRLFLAATAISLALVSVSASAVDVIEVAKATDVLERVRDSLPDDNPALARAFGLSGGEGITPLKSRQTPDGRTVTRFVQTYKDIPVWGRQLIVQRNAAGKVVALKGDLIKGIGRELRTTVPGLDKHDITASLRQDIVNRMVPATAVFKREKADLVIHVADDGVATLAYAVEFLADSEQGGQPTRPVYLVNAETGETLQSYDAIAYQSSGCTDGCVILNESGLSGTAASGRGKRATPASFDMFPISVPSDVPAGSTLTVSTSAASGDLDLYVRKGTQPTTSAYDCRPYLNGSSESCEFIVNGGEVFWAGLYAYTDFSGATLTARASAPIVVEKIGDGPGGNEKVGLYYYDYDFAPLDVATSNGQCVFLTPTVKTVDLNNGTSGSTAYRYGDGVDCFHDLDPVNGAFSPLNDAHYFGGVVFDMYQAYLNTAPLSFSLTMRVHYSTDYENAFWDGSAMTFGDGKSVFHPLVSLDVSAHEVSHGFTEQNSGLIYSDQSGGMNEAFSDIAGEAAEYYMRGIADYLVGADIFKASGSLRNMINPPADGVSIGHASDYQRGMDVHYSSGVFNRAFYQLAAVQGWGVQQAFEVFAWANQNCWVPNSTFQQGAQCVLDEAMAVGYDGNAVAAAFDVVGIVLDVPQPPGPPAAPALSVSSFTYQQVVLNWNTAANVDSYTILRSIDGGATYATQATVSGGSFTDNTVSPETAYRYKVVAANVDGETDSNPVDVTTPAIPAPGSFSVTADPVQFNQVTLSWTASQNATRYAVARRLDSEADFTELLSNTTQRSWTDNGVQPETAYVYRVTASNDGAATAEAEESVTTPAEPVAPSLTLSAAGYKVKGFNTADLSWSPSGSYTLSIDGSQSINVSGAGYTDNTGQKGGMTRTYQICDTASGECSAEVTVVW